MRRPQSTLYDLFGLIMLASLLAATTYAAWRGHVYTGLAILAIVDSAVVWGISAMLIGGLHAPTAFEHCEGRATLRTVGLLIGGSGLFYAGTHWGPLQKSWVMFGFLVVWLGSSLLAATKMRRRDETIASYKRRIHYHEPSQPNPTDIHKRPSPFLPAAICAFYFNAV